MNSLNEVGRARQGLPRGRVIGLEERGDMIVLPIPSRELEPSEGVFEYHTQPRSMGLSSGP